jgi:hypothetical protein
MTQCTTEPEIENMMVVIEELTIPCLLSNEELFLKDIQLTDFITNEIENNNQKYVSNYLKMVMTMVN